MKDLRRWFVVVPAVALVLLLGWLFWTRGTMEQLAFLRKGASGVQSGLVDQRPWQTATTLGALAVSGEEQMYAQQAERLADHEVDQAFAQALRQAAMQQRVLTGAAGEQAGRVEELKALVKDDQARVDGLTAAAKSSGAAAMEGDELDVTKAQLGLDQDELVDATADLARESGDRRGDIQQELAAREAAQKKSEEGAKKEGAVVAAKRYQTLSGRASAWLDQRSRVALIEQARVAEIADAKGFAAQHDALEKKAARPQVQSVGATTQNSDAKPGAPGVSTGQGEHPTLSGSAGKDAAPGFVGRQVGGSERVALLKAAAAKRVMMSILDDRDATSQQLAVVYGQWEAQVWLQHRIVTYLVMQSLAWIALIVLIAALLVIAGRALLLRLEHTDQRRARTLGTLLMVAVEALSAIAILLVVFGVPEHTPTILGLATAGLTVVFQDYILAFFGWFVLMGRNGIRVCDWVEIDGVGGEVAEIGLFRTTLLETGNWTSRGHPTGRKVAFTNSFAIRGRYFNFSTHGQWMWDEIKLNVPATANAYDLIKRMQAKVVEVTTNDTAQAEAEWQSATRQNALAHFKALPTVDLRPAASGVDVLIRFVTRANDRFEMRRELYEAVIGLMEGTEKPPAEGLPVLSAGPAAG